MCVDNNFSDEIKLEHKILGNLCKSDDNLLSFLCGIFSNIPITLCFIFAKFGNSVLEYINFALILLAISVSIALVVFAFKFTIRKMRYISPRLVSKGEVDKNFEINNILTEFMPLSSKQRKIHRQQITKYQYLVRPVVGFFICSILLIIVIILLWILNSFIC